MKSYFKKISIISITIFTFLLSENIFAMDIKVLKNTSENTVVSVGRTDTIMIEVDGITKQAYCAHYKLGQPQTGTAYSVKTISNSTGIGLATIIEDTTITSGFTDIQKTVVKTMAINLYLSEKDNINRFSNNSSLCFDDKCATRSYGADWWVTQANENGVAVTPFHGNIDSIEQTNRSPGFSKIKAGFKNAYDNNGDRYQSAVYQLYLNAINATPAQEPHLMWDTSRTEKLQLSSDGKTYSGTYYVNSNVELSSLTAIVDGVDPSRLSKTEDISNKRIVISFPVDAILEGFEEVTVDAEAKVKQKKAIVYAPDSEHGKLQDFVFAEGNFEEITIKTTDWAVQIKIPCYEYKINCPIKATCENTNSSNEGTCESKIDQYYATTCASNDSGNHLSGKQMIKLIDGVCSLYCTEKATVYYPGNVSPAITLGTNFTWPTNINGLYPLKTSAKLDCKVEMDDGSAVTTACLNAAANRTYQYDNGNEVAQLKYNDISADKNINLQQHCISGSSVNGTSVTITNNCYYTLPDGEKSLISKETVKFVNKVAVEATAATSNYILTQYHGVLPVSGYHWTDKGEFSKEMFANSYKLEITNLPLGFDGQFTSELKDPPYVCNYKVTKGIEGVVYPCLCPPGTPNDGLDLYSYIKDNTMTCTEAKYRYCNIESTCPLDSDKPGERPAEFVTCMNTNDYNYCAQENCYKDIDLDPFCIDKDTGDKKILTDCLKNYDWTTCAQMNNCTDMSILPSCPPGSSHPERNCVQYVANGGTEAQCIAEWCNDPCPDCKYICPEGSDLYPMDISGCVSGQRGAGVPMQEALNYCYKYCDINCPPGASNCVGSGTIIYRTISLENPFPSKNANLTPDVNGPKVGDFNTTVAGRYPGTNWKSVDLVQDKILNNRGYDGSAIYQEATPLYTFNLDATAIKKIRDYNTKQAKESAGYADWDLTCTNGAYCISEFVHKSGITTATGNSILDSSNSTCANASNKSSFISCYNQP